MSPRTQWTGRPWFRTQWIGRAAVAGLVSLGLAAALAVAGTPGGAGADDTSGGGTVTRTATVTRTELVGGQSKVVDTRNVTLEVSQTDDLQGRQEIGVSWSGAHPTGGVVADQNSDDAQREEYPFVLLQCRGVDSASAPAGQQLSPATCWTQTWNEHYQDSLGDTYPPYRLDQYASAADRAAIVGAPSPMPASCKFDESAPVQHWVPFVAAGGHVYDGGNAGCAGEPPESQDVGGSGLPSNETFGVTAPDGTGNAEFDVWTATENASLGCSSTVPCALVAVPVMGISCDASSGAPAGDVSQCEEAGAFTPGQLMPSNGQDDLTVSGSLWWSASNWRNRITVPLSFAPTAASCSVTAPSNHVIDVYGSELMIQATGQWAPSFCLDDKGFSFVHVQTGEPEARNLVAAGGAEAAFTSDAQPGGYGKPVVNAPVAMTGFAISYAIDGSNGQPYTTLELTPRLLAKLLTESYPGDLFLQQADPALAHNPLNITLDPEFTALNPGVGQNHSASDEAASELIALSGDSDVIEALTAYIQADPTARAWLDGTPDQWGMTVNPAYKGIALPVDKWPLLSTFEPTAWYDSDNNDCLHTDPVPYQPLVSAPLATLEDISESIQYDLPNSTTVCSQPVPGSAAGEKLVTNGRQPVGHRFLLGITPLADNQRYQLRAAALQSAAGDFVTPSDASLQAAGALLTPDTATGTWPVPYAALRQPAGAAAYPGSMVVYAAVPTSGLPAEDAADYASLLRFAVTTGQTPGFGVGQLPPGYLPLTTADGLGGLAAYTLAAAEDVAAQNGQIPPLTPVSTGDGSTPGGGGGSSLTSAGDGADFPGLPFSMAGAGTTAAGQSGAKHVTALPPNKKSSSLLPLGPALGLPLWTGRLLLELVLLAAVAGVLAVPLALAAGRKRGWW